MSSLPKLNVPTFELTLPSNGKKVVYRPFLVKEHKTLLILKDSEDGDVIRILEELVDVCTFNKLKIKDIPSFDMEYLFLNIRAKSIGEAIDLIVNCDCGNKIDYSMDISKLNISKHSEHSTKIQVSSDVGVEMRYPKFHDTMDIFITRDETKIFDLVLSCIKAIYTADTYTEITIDNREELVEFIENMTQEQFDKIEQFFVTMPKLKQEINVKCDKCGADNHAVLEGLQNFFV
jgi:hypothetical protein